MGLVHTTISLFFRSRALRHWTILLGCLGVVLALPGSQMAQQPPGWQWQNPLPQGNAINSIRFAADKKYGWAVGSDGAILHTPNGGFEWEGLRNPSQPPTHTFCPLRI